MIRSEAEINYSEPITVSAIPKLVSSDQAEGGIEQVDAKSSTPHLEEVHACLHLKVMTKELVKSENGHKIIKHATHDTSLFLLLNALGLR